MCWSSRGNAGPDRFPTCTGRREAACPGLPLGAARAYNGPMGTMQEKRKQSLYFPEEMLREIQAEATRQDRSLSWIVQHAWTAARERIRKMPGMQGLGQPATAPIGKPDIP
jgi:uncharacterized small protein (TIGR04563 family)